MLDKANHGGCQPRGKYEKEAGHPLDYYRPGKGYVNGVYPLINRTAPKSAAESAGPVPPAPGTANGGFGDALLLLLLHSSEFPAAPLDKRRGTLPTLVPAWYAGSPLSDPGHLETEGDRQADAGICLAYPDRRSRRHWC